MNVRSEEAGSNPLREILLIRLVGLEKLRVAEPAAFEQTFRGSEPHHVATLDHHGNPQRTHRRHADARREARAQPIPCLRSLPQTQWPCFERGRGCPLSSLRANLGGLSGKSSCEPHDAEAFAAFAVWQIEPQELLRVRVALGMVPRRRSLRRSRDRFRAQAAFADSTSGRLPVVAVVPKPRHRDRPRPNACERPADAASPRGHLPLQNLLPCWRQLCEWFLSSFHRTRLTRTPAASPRRPPRYAGSQPASTPACSIE